MNLFNVVKVLQKFEIPAVYVSREIFRIGDKELTINKNGMVYTDTARWRYNSYKDFFYSLKSERLIYLTREQMADVCSYYYILTERPKERKSEVEKSFRYFPK